MPISFTATTTCTTSTSGVITVLLDGNCTHKHQPMHSLIVMNLDTLSTVCSNLEKLKRRRRVTETAAKNIRKPLRMGVCTPLYQQPVQLQPGEKFAPAPKLQDCWSTFNPIAWHNSLPSKQYQHTTEQLLLPGAPMLRCTIGRVSVAEISLPILQGHQA